MPTINITFNTPRVPSFKWYESHERLTIQELNELVIQCRSATAAFSTELNDRHFPSPQDEETRARHQSLGQTAEQINHQGLGKAHLINMQGLYGMLDDPQGQAERTPSRLARHFIWLVSRILGWPYALLVLCTFGREIIRKLNESQRARIITHIFDNRNSLFCQPLQDQATSCNLDQICKDSPQNLLK